MLKLVKAYRAAPTLQNAIKVRTYFNKHPLGASLMSQWYCDALAAALAHANAESVKVDQELADYMDFMDQVIVSK